MGLSSPHRANEVTPTTPVAGRVLTDGKYLSRGGQRYRIRGVTYGPFAPDEAGGRFPEPQQVEADLIQMTAAGINALRTYHVPPPWLLEQAEEHRVSVFIDVPWPKHVCFLQSAQARAEARRAVRDAAEFGKGRGGILAYSVGNEVQPDVVRWHGARRIERFIAELGDVARQVDPERLVTYANFPPTEYLDLATLDLVTFNVYLHDPTAFRSYLLRLQNLTGDRPLLLGELGMDTLRHGEMSQAEFLSGHIRQAVMAGLAGVFVFSWTDDWHTGGHQVGDWAFGITRADRIPKISYQNLLRERNLSLQLMTPVLPHVSVIVCTYNGGRTIEQCLLSLKALDYPHYEVIVVDDGSTDTTGEILDRFPEIVAIRQPNLGLSVARNVGLARATGSIVAYTDSDCFVDPDWLTLLVDQLHRNGAGAVGGPNLSPDDGWLAACIAAAPGQPSHVLLEDEIAEHIPGCNMAFRREALEAINGFDPRYRTAGDDVDVCWRLQNAGFRITFAPGAFVWHHRRQTPRRYLRQQAGYGEAEALLSFTHPERFTTMGSGKWHGVVYGPSPCGLRLSSPLIYRGTFGTGLFQCIYRPSVSHWAMLPSTLEWLIATIGSAGLAVVWSPFRLVALVMFALSMVVTILQAAQARLERRHRSWATRPLIAILCYLQPLVRSWARYRTRLSAHQVPRPGGRVAKPRRLLALPWFGSLTVAYWSERICDRIDFLQSAIRSLEERRWGRVLDSGWSEWDVAVHCGAGLILKICTVQEEHGDGNRLIRVRYRLAPVRWTMILEALAVGGLTMIALTTSIPPLVPISIAGLLIVGQWRMARRAASRVTEAFDTVAGNLGLVPCPPEPAHRRWRSRRNGPRDNPGSSVANGVVPPGPSEVDR